MKGALVGILDLDAMVMKLREVSLSSLIPLPTATTKTIVFFKLLNIAVSLLYNLKRKQNQKSQIPSRIRLTNKQTVIFVIFIFSFFFGGNRTGNKMIRGVRHAQI